MIRFVITAAVAGFIGYSLGSGRLHCRLGDNTAGCSVAPMNEWGIRSLNMSDNTGMPLSDRWTEPQSHGSFRATSNPVPLHSR